MTERIDDKTTSKKAKPTRFHRSARAKFSRSVYVEYYRVGNAAALTLQPIISRLFNHLGAVHSITLPYTGNGHFTYIDVYRIPLGKHAPQEIFDKCAEHGIKAHALRRRDKGHVSYKVVGAGAKKPGLIASRRREKDRLTSATYDKLCEMRLVYGEYKGKGTMGYMAHILNSPDMRTILETIARENHYTLPDDWRTKPEYVTMAHNWFVDKHYRDTEKRLRELQQFCADNYGKPELDSVIPEYLRVKELCERLDELRSKESKEEKQERVKDNKEFGTNNKWESAKRIRLKEIVQALDETDILDARAHQAYVNGMQREYPIELPHKSTMDTIDDMYATAYADRFVGYYDMVYPHVGNHETLENELLRTLEKKAKHPLTF